MKVAVIGTSNSVMTNGWVSHLKRIAPAEWQISNFSLGASPSLYGSYAVTKYDIATKFDVAFLDFTINDQQFIDNANLSIEYVVGSYSALLRHFSTPEAICSPVALLLPQKAFVETGKCAEAHDAVVALCERYRVQVVDEFKMMAHSKKLGASIDEIFADWGHFTTEFQKIVAGDAIAAIRSPPVERPKQSILFEAPTIQIVPRADVEYVGAERRIVGTSLVSNEVDTIRNESSGTIYNAPFLVGIVHWIDEASGPISFEGKNAKVKKALRKEWKRMFAITHFRNPLEGGKRIQFYFGDKEGYLLEGGFGLAKNTPVSGEVADIAGFLKSDSDPILAGAALLKKLNDVAIPGSKRTTV